MRFAVGSSMVAGRSGATSKHAGREDGDVVTKVDESHLPGLLGSAGKRIAFMPGAKGVVEQMRRADSRESFARLLHTLDLGVEPPARATIERAANDAEKWREVHATLVRAAEQALIDRFHPSA